MGGRISSRGSRATPSSTTTPSTWPGRSSVPPACKVLQLILRLIQTLIQTIPTWEDTSLAPLRCSFVLIQPPKPQVLLLTLSTWEEQGMQGTITDISRSTSIHNIYQTPAAPALRAQLLIVPPIAWVILQTLCAWLDRSLSCTHSNITIPQIQILEPLFRAHPSNPDQPIIASPSSEFAMSLNTCKSCTALWL